MSSLPTIAKTFQDQAPSGIESAVKITYDTCLRSPAAIGRTLLKDHGDRYYGSTRKILSRRVCRNECFPISLIGAVTPAMQLHWTSLILTVKRHGLGCSDKRMTVSVSSYMNSMNRSNTLPSPPGIIQLSRRRTSTKMDYTSDFPVTPLKSTPTMS